MSKPKWSKRQRKAIEKVIKHYEYVLEDLSQRRGRLLVSAYCPFCQMFSCKNKKKSKCPVAITSGSCEGQSQLVEISARRFNYCCGAPNSEELFREAILARIEFWEGQL